jgi:uncharacterized protein YggE
MTPRLRAVAIAATIALLITAATLAGCKTEVVTAPSGPAVNTVTAPGTGKAAAIPDMATMSFGVTAQAKEAKSALDQASAEAAKITDALKKAGVADKDIQTQDVSVYPQYDPNNSKTITGYQASLSVSAKVRDIASLGKVISAATAAGAEQINGPTFGLSEKSTYQDEAIQKAVDDAKAQATSMAKASGKQVGDVLSISSVGVNAPSPIMFGAADYAPTAGAKSVPIQPGQLDVTANVTVVFQLK